LNLVDVNVWLALALSAHRHHDACREWLDALDEPATAIFCRATQSAFLRLLTNTSVFAPYGNRALTNREAWDAYEALAADDRIVLEAREPAGLEQRWRELATGDTASPKLWMDAYMAAFALAGDCRMVTTDAGFRQFSGVDLLLLGPAVESS
jgi:toxin-antitoxin system PIN domain toxin